MCGVVVCWCCVVIGVSWCVTVSCVAFGRSVRVGTRVCFVDESCGAFVSCCVDDLVPEVVVEAQVHGKPSPIFAGVFIDGVSSS